MDWADDRVVYLRELFATNRFSASDMAAKISIRFDCDLTRNAVIGKLFRLGLVRQGRLPRFGNRVVKPKKNSIRPFNMGGASAKAPKPAPEQGPPEFTGDPSEIAPEQRRSLLDLTNETCRWPYGEPSQPDFFFCGALEADCQGERPYCAAHSKMARPRSKPMSAGELARRQQHGQWLSRVAARKRAAA